jgi:hypothetical protein
MNRLAHIQKAQAALGQVIEHLERIGADAEILRCEEVRLMALEAAEPCGDPDPYLTSLEEA